MEEPVETVKARVRASPVWRWPVHFGRALLDQLYPPVCLSCSAPAHQHGGLCAICWRTLRPISAPLCPVLGIPFTVSMGPNAVSPEALATPPSFDRARSAVVYNAEAQAIVSRLKYGDHPELARFCAGMMTSAGAEVLYGDAVLVPVPLHPWRQWWRRYNQSAEIARAIARLTGLEMHLFVVRRQRATRQQVGLSAVQRRRNVTGAFSVDPAACQRLDGRRIILVDDVITTGATVGALARELKRAGCIQIDVISFARVVIGDEMTI